MLRPEICWRSDLVYDNTHSIVFDLWSCSHFGFDLYKFRQQENVGNKKKKKKKTGCVPDDVILYHLYNECVCSRFWWSRMLMGTLMKLM